MNIEDLEARLRNVEDQLALDKIEKMYGYYLDNGKFQEAIDLFSDDAESVEIFDRGVFKGKEGVKRFFGFMAQHFEGISAGWLNFHHQLQSVIDIAPNGKTAKGRWYLLWITAAPLQPGEPPRSVLGHGVYENDFVKENGKWKIWKMFCSLHFFSPLPEGWTNIPVFREGRAPGADAPPTAYHPYPNIRYVPFHWEDPTNG